MLKHQRQGFNECLITTIAILMDIPKDRLLKIALEEINMPEWGNTSTTKRVEGLKAIKREFPDRYPLWLPIMARSENCLDYGLNSAIQKMEHYRGAVVVVSVIFGGHIAAFEYGTVYDPSRPEPLPIHHWWPYYDNNGFVVNHVFTDPTSYRA